MSSRQPNITLPPIKDHRGLGVDPGLANPDPFKHSQPKQISNSNKSNRGVAFGGSQTGMTNFENTPPQWGSEMDKGNSSKRNGYEKIF